MSSSNWVSARIAASGLDRSCRSVCSRSRASAIRAASGTSRAGGGPAGRAPTATGPAPTWRRRFPPWTVRPRYPEPRTGPGLARCRPRCGAPGGGWR
ncbi:MAG: hypothetical protein DMD65_11495 [Gemmatimonadetes bacterium]|nr:MAG: hypothetical protein DMD65_11495 [Gemmatimonadota bacterium]